MCPEMPTADRIPLAALLAGTMLVVACTETADPPAPPAASETRAPAEDTTTVPGTNLVTGGENDRDRNCIDGGRNAYQSFGPRAFDRRAINGGRPRPSRCR